MRASKEMINSHFSFHDSSRQPERNRPLEQSPSMFADIVQPEPTRTFCPILSSESHVTYSRAFPRYPTPMRWGERERLVSGM